MDSALNFNSINAVYQFSNDQLWKFQAQIAAETKKDCVTTLQGCRGANGGLEPFPVPFKRPRPKESPALQPPSFGHDK